MVPSKDSGRIITFYSYKGGTGRSMAVANVAWLLAAAGKRVLMIDWDLEAPGLHRYVHPFLDDPGLTESEGVIDFVISYTEEASSKKLDENLDPKWFAPYANITRFAVPLDYEFSGGGTLDFIPAGKQGPAYAGRVNSFNWRDFYVRLGGRAVLEEARARVRENYDFVLIDSRTGVSDTSGICTVEMPDDVAVCFTLNMQSVTGAASAARSMLEQRPPNRPLQLFPVAMRVVDAELEKTRIVREYAKGEFLGLMSESAVESKARDKYWHEVEVRQVAFYAFEEQLAYFLDSPNDPSAVLAAMKNLAWRMTGVDVLNLPGPETAKRAEVLATYSAVWGKAPTPKPQETAKRFVYVSYHEYSLPGPGSPPPAVTPEAGLTGEVVTAAGLSRDGCWLEAIRSVLRRSSGMLVMVDGNGIGQNQRRELAAAFDHQSRSGGPSAFPITAVPAGIARLGHFPAMTTLQGRSSPFPGLHPFRTEDAGVFFGREAFVEKLAEQMQSAPTIVLGGKPGSGKRSAIRAGLVPKLLLEEAPRQTWKVAVCDLSSQSEFYQSALTVTLELVRLRGTARFEEQVRKEASDLMARLSKEGFGLVKEVVTSVLGAWPAADRLAIICEAGSATIDDPYLSSLFHGIPQVSVLVIKDSPAAGQITLPPLAREDLIRAIEEPLRRAGLSMESGLAARIAADVDDQDDALALLQFCMALLCEYRQAAGEQVIRAADYEAIGGVSRMVEIWAESVYDRLSPAERDPALRVMCRLSRSRLRPEDVSETLRGTVEKLVDQRLLRVEAAGDVRWYSLVPLALRWPRLAKAVAENAQFLDWRAGFQVPAGDATDARYSALLRGDALAIAQRYLAERPDDFTPREAAFIERSEAQAHPMAAPAAAAPPRKRRIASSLAGLAVVVLGLSVFFQYQLRPKSAPSTAGLLATAYQQQQQKDYTGAIGHLTDYLRVVSDPALIAQAYSLRAYCYRMQEDWDRAIPDLTAALAVPLDAADRLRLLKDRAYAYIQARRPAEALEDYRAARKLAPDDPNLTNQWLTDTLTPTLRIFPPVFIIMKIIANLAEVPSPVMKLYPTPVPYLNIRGWAQPIPRNEVRFNDPNDSALAQRIAEALTKGGIAVKDPVLVPQAAGRHLEVWLAYQ